MARLEATGIGKRFHRNWIFRNVNLSLNKGERLLVTGSNGSGKSTLMRILAGQLSPTQGTIQFSLNDKKIGPESWYRHFSWSGPYMDLYPELTLKEAVAMHLQFRESYASQKDMIHLLKLDDHQDKELRHFSSGMIHRVKVGLAIFSKSEILLLDEATTNMDRENGELIWDLVRNYQHGRALVWASNKESEFNWFDMRLEL